MLGGFRTEVRRRLSDFERHLPTRTCHSLSAMPSGLNAATSVHVGNGRDLIAQTLQQLIGDTFAGLGYFEAFGRWLVSVRFARPAFLAALLPAQLGRVNLDDH